MIRWTAEAKRQVESYILSALAPCGVTRIVVDESPLYNTPAVVAHFEKFKSIRADIDPGAMTGDLSDLIKRLTPPDYVPPPKPKTDAEIAVELRSVAVNSPGERMLCEAVARLLERK